MRGRAQVWFGALALRQIKQPARIGLGQQAVDAAMQPGVAGGLVLLEQLLVALEVQLRGCWEEDSLLPHGSLEHLARLSLALLALEWGRLPPRCRLHGALRWRADIFNRFSPQHSLP